MRILVLGGTQFVGRHIAEEFHRAGDSVTLFCRGETRDDLPRAMERRRGDRDHGLHGLDSLGNDSWDACIDVSGLTPRQVGASVQRLQSLVGHYVFISAVSVYGDPQDGPVTEAFPLVPPAADSVTEIDSQTYGPLKVACERLVTTAFPGRFTILRPQIIAGPYDPYDRLSYWVRRAGEAGAALLPGDGTDCLQLIDARDVARFVRLVCEARPTGVFNLAGHRLTWKQFASLLEIQQAVWIPTARIRAAGVRESELPLFRGFGESRSRLMDVSAERAIRLGLTLTDLKDTLRWVRDWLPQCELRPALSHERERQLLEMADHSGKESD